LSQSALAQGLGITFQQVQKYERGYNRVSASILVKIAARLATTVAALVGEDGAPALDTGMYRQLWVPGAPQLMAAFTDIEDKGVRQALLLVARAIVEAGRAQEEARELAKRVASGASRS
jgi:transcriptional regulator with XRE-family HTH domain